MEKIVSFTSYYKSGIYSSLGTIGIFENKLYFYNNVSETNPETQLENTYCQVYSYDLTTDSLSDPILLPQKYTDVGGSIFCADSNNFYIRANGCIYTTTHDFSHEALIAEYTPGEGEIVLYYMDEFTGEIFLLVGNYRDNKGDIYTILDGKFEKILLPHENIYYFQLTQDNIYYSTYDPYLYGTDPNGRQLYEYGGGKIHVTDRKTRSISNEVFYNNHELPIRDKWYIIGDNIYLDYLQFMQEGDTVWFSAAMYLKKARINVQNNTIIYFRFD